MDNRPHFKPGAIKYTRGYGIRMFFAKLLGVIFSAIALAVICLTIYVYAKQPVKYVEGNEFVNAVTIHRMFKPGDEVIIVETENYNIFTPLQRFIIPQITYQAEVIAGPYGKIKPTGKENEYTVTYADNKAVVNLINPDKEYLDIEYVIRQKDIYGNYGKEADRITTKNEILGLIKADE